MKESKRKTSRSVKIIFVILVIIGVWAIFFAPNPDKKKEVKTVQVKTESVESSDMNRNFSLALKGETWEILDDNIAVMDTPETYSTHDVFASHIVTMLGPGEKVIVLKTQGFFSQWKYCQVKGMYHGWILAETVKDSKRIK